MRGNEPLVNFPVKTYERNIMELKRFYEWIFRMCDKVPNHKIYLFIQIPTQKEKEKEKLY